MPKTIFDDPKFISKLNKSFESAHAKAKAENRDVQEIIKSELNETLDNIGILINEGIDALKKREKFANFIKIPRFYIVATSAERLG